MCRLVRGSTLRFACNDVIFGYPYFSPAGQVFANVTLAYTLPTT